MAFKKAFGVSALSIHQVFLRRYMPPPEQICCFRGFFDSLKGFFSWLDFYETGFDGFYSRLSAAGGFFLSLGTGEGEAVVRLVYLPGVMPSYFLKMRIKVATFSNPTACPTLASGGRSSLPSSFWPPQSGCG